jgi:hypothetical protein
MKASKPSITWKKFTESRLFFPLVALALVLLFDLVFIPGFFNLSIITRSHGGVPDMDYFSLPSHLLF